MNRLTAADREALALQLGVLRRQALDELRGTGPYSEADSFICIDCDKNIPRERLLAQPTAIRCAACQAVAENRRRR